MNVLHLTPQPDTTCAARPATGTNHLIGRFEFHRTPTRGTATDAVTGRPNHIAVTTWWRRLVRSLRGRRGDPGATLSRRALDATGEREPRF